MWFAMKIVPQFFAEGKQVGFALINYISVSTIYWFKIVSKSILKDFLSDLIFIKMTKSVHLFTLTLSTSLVWFQLTDIDIGECDIGGARVSDGCK